MSKSAILLIAIGLLIGLSSSFSRQVHEVEFVAPAGWPEPSYNFSNNPLSAEGIALGSHLFYDPILSADSSTSCANCHLSYTAFTHVDHALSHGIHDSVGNRNSMALTNLAWSTSFMWDGAVNHLDMQALAPITDPRELGTDLEVVLSKLKRSAHYRKGFSDAFDGAAPSIEYLLKALAQFQLTLISANAKYDQVMRNEPGVHFSAQEEQGMQVFNANCSSCHTPPLFTNGGFANNGLKPDSSLMDMGRMSITDKPEDAYTFKVPSLRNIAFSKPYMHDGRFVTMGEVLRHYTHGIHDSQTLAPALKDGLGLSEHEQVDLSAFLLTLTDKEFLFNPKHAFPKELLNQTKE